MADNPPRRVADSLTEATAGSVIYVDQRGQVRPAREQGQRLTRYFVTLGLGMTAATALYWMVGGPFGLAVGAALTLLFLRDAPAHQKLNRASRLMAAERLAEAEPLLRRLTTSRLVSETMRGRAERFLAMVVVARGDHQQALALQTSALARMRKHRSLRYDRRALVYSQVITLVNLDRTGEAAALFARLPRLLEGDYLRVLRAHAELYLALAEGRQQFHREELRAQADLALAMPHGRAWLMLLASAYGQMGDRASAARLLAVAETRPSVERLRAMFPKLFPSDGGR